MLQVGIIGYGRIGNEHAAWINASGMAQVAGVYDPTPGRREIAAAKGFRVFDDVATSLDDASIGAVLIATPTSMHCDDTLQALTAGKHVMVEKPMALDYADAVRMHRAAIDAGRVLSVFQCRRWDIDFLTVRQLIASGELGKLINVESRLGQWSSCVGPAAREYRPNWRNERAFGGGGLYDWGSHFIDQLAQLMLPDAPVRVFAQLRGNVWSSDCDDFARVIIDFASGAVALCEINTTTTRPLPRWHIDGTLGSADAPHSATFDTHQWAQLTLADPAGVPRSVKRANPGLSESDIWACFARACSDGIEPAVTVDSVLTTMRLLDAARESSRTGKAIDLAAAC